MFSKMLFLLEQGTHFCKTTSSKFNLFLLCWPPNGLDKSIFCNCICSFRSFGRSDRHFFAPCPHQNIASGCSPVHFSPPEPRQQKWVYASLQQFCQFRIRSAVFFVPSMLRAPFFTKYHPIFWKYAPRPRWEAWFWKRHKSKIMKNMPLGPSKYACIHPFCSTYCNLRFAKSIWKCIYVFVYGPFSEAIFSIVCFIAWLRGDISTFLHRIWPHFVQKCSPHSVLQKRKLMQHMFR